MPIIIAAMGRGFDMDVDVAEFHNMVIDEHNTAMETIQEIRQALQAERAKFAAIIDDAAQNK